MAANDAPGHLLTLKVMRISRPELGSAWQPFYSSSPSFSAHSSAAILSLQGTTPLPGHPKTLRDLTHASELLTLPSSFGSIQLGETFSSCLCINNETELGVEVVQMRVEMQTVTTKVVLHEMDDESTMLPGGDTLEHVVHHEIKELGQHVLACTVTYRLPSNSRSVPGASEDVSDPSLQTFRKFYKFAVTNPLAVKTKVHTPKSPSALLSPSERDKIFLEVHIQNLTHDAICFERMKLECSDGWDAEDVNVMLDEHGHESSIFSGPTSLIQPQDMRQYIYILTPKNSAVISAASTPGNILPLGRLDISWRSSFGEPGRLLTSMLSRRIPIVPAAQPVSAVPSHVKKAIATSLSSRPRSPSGTQSRSETPPPGNRPSSPSLNRSSLSNTLPAVPQQTIPTVVALPDLEAQLLVKHIPRTNIMVEKGFSIAFSVILSSSLPSDVRFKKRRVKLAIQHLKSRKSLPVPAVPLETFSPKLPSSGFSTPSSSTVTFNYALAHQKILAASNRPPISESPLLENVPLNIDTNVLPPPYFESGREETQQDNVSFTGPSAVLLPEITIDYSEVGQEEKGGIQVVQDFDLPFIALRKGFSNVGGVRVLQVGDQVMGDSEGDEHLEFKAGATKVQILKEYEVVGEVWVAA
ncbi:hypothetical protein D9613_002848 [Agrocybe pediades]|uniref:DUF974-domain-containing protein n=1 Tax=Agrocybe pediades TaxID=84607 RepID=A0A8H4QQ21_9AGAR|nr:hypothetical protein D9613_002848 [Agrocybe pediades]KAF9557694.1 DUF974-domain-containing protein [Agrocybe pediades]